MYQILLICVRKLYWSTPEMSEKCTEVFLKGQKKCTEVFLKGQKNVLKFTWEVGKLYWSSTELSENVMKFSWFFWSEKWPGFLLKGVKIKCTRVLLCQKMYSWKIFLAEKVLNFSWKVSEKCTEVILRGQKNVLRFTWERSEKWTEVQLTVRKMYWRCILKGQKNVLKFSWIIFLSEIVHDCSWGVRKMFWSSHERCQNCS